MEIEEVHRDELSSTRRDSLTELANLVDHQMVDGDPPLDGAAVHAELFPGTPMYTMRFWAAWDGDRALGIVRGDAANVGPNRHLGEIAVGVHPEHRRRGIGSTLHETAMRALEADGRTDFFGWGLIGEDTRGFWSSLGKDLRLIERVSRCRLETVDRQLMQSWIDRAGERAADYHLERWVGRCPAALIERYAQVKTAMNDAPLGDLDVEDELIDVERMRDFEDLKVGRGIETRAIMAIETATGHVAGYTAVSLPHARPAVSTQSDTVTLPEHRNRGIGRWLKAEMWQWLRAERPDVLSLDTDNAESNDAMLSINVAMGFETVSQIGAWQ